MKKQNEHPVVHEEAFISYLNKVIAVAIKVLAVLMVLVILWSVVDVGYIFIRTLQTPPFMLLKVGDIFKIFSAFLVVLIAVEIFQNIIMYLRTDSIPIQLVLATALMAIARKVIIIDFDELTPLYIFAIDFVVLSLGVTYYLVNKNIKVNHQEI